ncbi:MAG: hypothetical protein JWN72_117, partial [Thermoleophilia bacterium]|nr:hypothetical protein [Thermoleophilia bacterium]
ASVALAATSAHATTYAAGPAPLARGEYFHTYATTFDPKLKNRPGAPKLFFGRESVPSSFETWFDSSAHGRMLMSNGTPTLKYSPMVSRDEQGNIGGISSGGTLQPGTTRAESLMYANSVNVLAWPAGGAAFQRAWVRTKPEYEKSYDGRLGGSQSAAARQRSIWGATYRQLAALPAAGAPLAAGVADLVGSPDRLGAPSFALPTGANGETAATRRQEERLYTAVALLTSAPMSDRQRTAVFHWLAAQPGARVTPRTRDHTQRPGTRVTFDLIHDRRVPARTVTAPQLVAEARAAGVTGLPDTTSTESWQVEAHREYRRFVLSVVVDPRSGALLESYGNASTSHSVKVPEVTYAPTRGTGPRKYTFRVSNGGGSTTFALGSMLWGVQERATSIVPRTPVCGRVARVCR